MALQRVPFHSFTLREYILAKQACVGEKAVFFFFQLIFDETYSPIDDYLLNFSLYDM